jgi:hypothetical protein
MFGISERTRATLYFSASGVSSFSSLLSWMSRPWFVTFWPICNDSPTTSRADNQTSTRSLTLSITAEFGRFTRREYTGLERCGERGEIAKTSTSSRLRPRSISGEVIQSQWRFLTPTGFAEIVSDDFPAFYAHLNATTYLESRIRRVTGNLFTR